MQFLTVVCSICLISCAFIVNIAMAEQRIFGLVAKRIDDKNFIDVWVGCNEEASKTNDKCELIGEERLTSPRFQVATINEEIKKRKLDALAISVTDSKYIAERLVSLTIPIITFDSPFENTEAHISDSYVGVDNIAFGLHLAKLVKKLHPKGGTICIMTAAHDTNLQQRVLGLRRGLSYIFNLAENIRLSGQGGWSEISRCPWNTADNEQRSLDQIHLTLDILKPDLLVSVGGWPLISPKNYRKTVENFRHRLVSKETLVIVGVGKIQADYTKLLDEALLHACLSINFVEMGRITAKIIRDKLNGKRVPRETYVSFVPLTSDNI